MGNKTLILRKKKKKKTMRHEVPSLGDDSNYDTL